MLCCTEKLAGGSQKHAFMTSDASTSILLSGSIPSICSMLGVQVTWHWVNLKPFLKKIFDFDFSQLT